METRPEITIGSRLEDGHMTITVADNGIGISEAHQKLIFEKFERIQTSVDGTGVGLYLVHIIVTSSGGTVSVESEVGKGTTFKIILKNLPIPTN